MLMEYNLFNRSWGKNIEMLPLCLTSIVKQTGRVGVLRLLRSMDPSIMRKKLIFRVDHSSSSEWILTQTSRKIHCLSCILLLIFGKNALMIRNILETKAVSR